MKRSVWTLGLVALVGAALVVPALAAGPSATKSVLGDDGSKAVVVVRVTAASSALYGVTIKDASGSIADIVAPKGWVGISSGRDVIFRTGDSPIKAGASASFRLVTSNEDGELTVSFRDKDTPVGQSKTL
jgi:hypothetical protein